MLKKGDIVKFDGNVEPCTVYRVLDDTVQMIEYAPGTIVSCIKPHIMIEVMGMVPVEFLRPAINSPDNIFAIDRLLKSQNRLT